MPETIIPDIGRQLKRGLVAFLFIACASTPAVSTVPTTTTASPTTTVTTAPPTTTTRAVTTTTTLVPVFDVVLDEVTATDLGVTWREGCPVGPSELRLLTLSHHGFDDQVHTGQLVIHFDWATKVTGVFQLLFEAGFPIERIEPMTVFGADDDAAMAANNSSGFNCRNVAGTNRWSEHAFGRAIDISPLVNPWVRGSQVDPPGGQAFLDRDGSVPGLIVGGDVVVEAFAAIGWGWGGYWSSPKDYMHFSSTGR
ncbi:MAG TPA: M15 family metallopeptidase [Acidimicrobiia bacterium]|nr:M15 family metallopeptidase [Acidimicrobiia bacterium]